MGDCHLENPPALDHISSPPVREIGPARRAFLEGARDVLPILLGVVPFGLIAGVSAVGTGLPAGQGLAMSVIVFAGASQLATLDLLGQGAPLAVIVLTALVIN
ncbi:MAG: AzlC family ABC transporter permease, partial [Thermodesulfobacteriota bacterium]